MMRKNANAVYAGVVLLVTILLGLFLNDRAIFIMMRMMCMALMAVALNLQFGFG